MAQIIISSLITGLSMTIGGSFFLGWATILYKNKFFKTGLIVSIESVILICFGTKFIIESIIP